MVSPMSTKYEAMAANSLRKYLLFDRSQTCKIMWQLGIRRFLLAASRRHARLAKQLASAKTQALQRETSAPYSEEHPISILAQRPPWQYARLFGKAIACKQKRYLQTLRVV
jgi:hypothetical protein